MSTPPPSSSPPPPPPIHSTGAAGSRRRSVWKRVETWVLITCVLFLFIGIRIIEMWSLSSLMTQRDHLFAEEQKLRVFVREEDVSSSSKPCAVISALYSDDYVDGLRVLGHSLNTHNVTATKVAIYIPEQVTKESLCLAEQAGWEMRPVERIEPLEGVRDLFRDQYTKLRIWEMEDEFSRIVYLDADTLVIGDITSLFTVPHAFAAVPDIYDTGYTSDFNAGVMSIRPSKQVFAALMKALPQLDFPRWEAEQAFLREYYRADVMLLPYKYNLNLAQLKYKPEDWDTIWEDGRIVHYTLYKPFLLPRAEGREGEFRVAFDRWWQAYDELAEVTTRSACSRSRILP